MVCAAAYERSLLMETSGPEGEVVKLLPPLTATRQELAEGLEILGESVVAARELQPA
jgi:diaminobutyrate-2-oxoglutarate transaminase